MHTTPFTPEHPDFDTLETRDAEPAPASPPSAQEDQAQLWTSKALFDCYND